MSKTIRSLFKLTASTLSSAPPAGHAIGGLLKVADTGALYVSRVVDGVAVWLEATDPFAAPEMNDILGDWGLPVRLTAPTLESAVTPDRAGGGLLKTLDDEAVYRAVFTPSGWEWVHVDDFNACSETTLPAFAMSYAKLQMERLRTIFDFTRTTAPDGAIGSNGTWQWTVPAWVKRFRIEALGAGAGGASGAVGAIGTARLGGIGGAGGGVEIVEIDADEIATRVLTVTVPAGGSGGTAVTSDSTGGNAGTAGGAAIVECDGETLVRAYGGGEAHGANVADVRAYHRGGDGWVAVSPSESVPTNASDMGPYQFSRFAGPGGGGGGGIAADDQAIVALPGVTPGIQPRSALVAAGAAAGQAGTAGSAPETGYVGASGGGGAAGDGTHDGGAGGAGSTGAGGGGGGAAPNGRNSGAGGIGGPGHIRISVLAI